MLDLDVESVISRWPGGELKSHKTFFVLFFQKVVQEELDALLEQQSTIENKMVALHRMGLVIPHPLPFLLRCSVPPCLLHGTKTCFSVVREAHSFSENGRL